MDKCFKMTNNCFFFLRFHQDKSNTLTKDQNKLSFNYFGCRFFGKTSMEDWGAIKEGLN